MARLKQLIQPIWIPRIPSTSAQSKAWGESTSKHSSILLQVGHGQTLYDQGAITGADLLNDKVLPFFAEQGMERPVSWLTKLRCDDHGLTFTTSILIGRSLVPHGEEALQKGPGNGGGHLRASRLRGNGQPSACLFHTGFHVAQACSAAMPAGYAIGSNP